MNYAKHILMCAFLGITAGAVISIRPQAPQPRPIFDPALRLPAPVAAFVTRSCADCHTAGTRLPWYGSVPPASWMIQSDIAQARKSMDLTAWSFKNGATRGRAMATLAAACLDVQSGRMPRSNYLWMHPQARPTPEDAGLFCSWTHSEIARLAAATGRETQ